MGGHHERAPVDTLVRGVAKGRDHHVVCIKIMIGDLADIVPALVTIDLSPDRIEREHIPVLRDPGAPAHIHLSALVIRNIHEGCDDGRMRGI